MDAEPTGRTIDGQPWADPRPPHLPDTLTRLSPWIIPFLVLALFQVVAGGLEWDAQGDIFDPDYGVTIVLLRLPGVAVALLGGALFLRHPDAHRRLPMLVVGVSLLTLAALMRLAIGALETVLLTALSGVDEGSMFVVHGIYSAAISVVSIVGLLYLARGLAGARRSPDVVSARGLGIVLTVLAVAATFVSVLAVLPISVASDLPTPLNMAAIALSLISTLAWSYLFVVASGGWLAREEPRTGWLLASLATGLEIAIKLFFAVGAFLDISRAGDVVFPILGIASVAVWVLLLFAFLAGLPSVAPTADPPAATQPGSGAG